MAEKMDPKKVVSAIKALQAAMLDIPNLGELPSSQYDARLHAALETANAKIKTIDADGQGADACQRCGLARDARDHEA